MKPENYQNIKSLQPSSDSDIEAFRKTYDSMSPQEKEAFYKYVSEERKGS